MLHLQKSLLKESPKEFTQRLKDYGGSKRHGQSWEVLDVEMDELCDSFACLNCEEKI